MWLEQEETRSFEGTRRRVIFFEKMARHLGRVSQLLDDGLKQLSSRPAPLISTRRAGIHSPPRRPGEVLRAGATVNDVKRLRELEAENAKLKRMYAELALENAAIKDVLSRKL